MSGSCGMQAKGNPAIKSERKAPAVARVRAAKAPSETQGPRTRYDEAKRRFRVHRAISTARYHMEVNQWRTPLMPSTKGRENANMSCRGVMSQDCGHPRTRTWRSGYLSCRDRRGRTCLMSALSPDHIDLGDRDCSGRHDDYRGTARVKDHPSVPSADPSLQPRLGSIVCNTRHHG